MKRKEKEIKRSTWASYFFQPRNKSSLNMVKVFQKKKKVQVYKAFHSSKSQVIKQCGSD